MPFLHAVIAGGRGTGVIDADAAGAIAGGITGQAVSTGSAVSATVEGGLGAVLHAVIAGGRGTGVDPTQTPLAQSPGALQAKPSAQAKAVSATVEGGLGAVLHAVITGGRGTGVIDADAAGVAGALQAKPSPGQRGLRHSRGRSRCRFARRHRRRQQRGRGARRY